MKPKPQNKSGNGLESMTMNVNGIVEKYRIIFRKVTSKSYLLSLEEILTWTKRTRLQFLAGEYHFKYIFVSVFKYLDLPELPETTSNPVLTLYRFSKGFPTH